MDPLTNNPTLPEDQREDTATGSDGSKVAELDAV